MNFAENEKSVGKSARGACRREPGEGRESL